MKKDIKRHFTDEGGILIQDKLLLGSKESYNLKEIQFLDLNQDGKVNKNGKSKK